MKRSNTIEIQDSPATPERFSRVRRTWVAYWMLGYFAFLEAALGPLMPFIRGELRLSYLLASLHFSAFALGAMMMGAIADRLTGWWGRRVSFWGGATGMAAGALLVALSPVAAGTIAGAFLMGLLGGLLLITIQAVLADHYGRWTPVALTEANVVASGFAFLAPVIIGLVTGAGLSWRLALFPIIVFYLVVGGLYRREVFPTHPASSVEKATGARTRLPLVYWALWLLIVLETGAEWCVAYWGASFLPGQADRASARLAVAGGLSALVAPFVLGALSDRIGIGAAFGVALPAPLLALLFAGVAGQSHARISA